MLHYIGLRQQLEQLQALGFEAQAHAFDLQGHEIVDDTADNSIKLAHANRQIDRR